MNAMPKSTDEDKIRRRVFGRGHAKPCKDESVIDCRRFLCQRANRCMLKPSKAAKEDDK